MKINWKDVINIIVGLIIIAGIAFALYSFVQFVVNLNTDLGKAIIAGSFTFLAAIVGVVLTKYYEEKNRVLFEIREKKIPIYESTLSFYMRLLNGEKAGAGKLTEEEMAKFMMDFTADLIVWGSDDVLDAWAKARAFSVSKNEYPDKASRMMLLLQNLMLEIRKDLGHKNKNIDKNHAILFTFINDVDTAVLNKIIAES